MAHPQDMAPPGLAAVCGSDPLAAPDARFTALACGNRAYCYTTTKLGGNVQMIVLGLICLILGLVLGIGILWTIGIILLVVGLILEVLGTVGHAVGGRRHYW